MLVLHIISALLGLAIAAPTPQSTAVQLIPGTYQPIVESNKLVSREPECTFGIEARDDASVVLVDEEGFVQPEESSILVSPTSNCPTPNARKHFLNICTEDAFGNAFPNDFMDKCVELSTHVAHHVSIIVQKPGLMCKFYDDNNGCSGNIRYTSKTLDKVHKFEPPSEFGNDLKYALCRRGDWRRDAGELEARDVSTSLSTTTDQSTRTDTAEVTTSATKHVLLAKIFSSTTSIQINEDYVDTCIPLSDRLSHDVTHSSQQHFTVCRFFESSCGTTPLLTVFSNGLGHFDRSIPSDVGSKITRVMCGIHHVLGEMAMQHGPGGIHAREDTSSDVVVHTAEDVVSDDPQDLDLPPLQWGQLRIGEDIGNTKLRKVVNALNTCTVFPGSIFPSSTRFLEQSGRSECSFYTKTECAGDPILQTLNPDEKDSEIDSELAQQINAATCTMLESISTASIEARSKPLPYVNPKDIHVTVDHSVSALSTPFLKVGDLYICNQPSLDPAACTVLHTLNQCVAFPGSFAYQTKVITQAKGSFCKYYTKSGCMDGDEYFRYMSNPTQDAQFSGWGVGKLAGVWCGGTGAASTADVNAIDMTNNNHDTYIANVKRGTAITASGNPFYHWSTSPGSTTVCHQKNFAFCTNNVINAIQQCANFAPADQGPASAIQYKGAYCKWYTDFGCASGEGRPYSILDSRGGDAYADGLLNGAEVRRYRSVKCAAGPW